jgi:hypothetical protein
MKNPFQLPEIDVSKMMSAFKMPEVNVEQLMASQQKNMEAFRASSQVMIEGMQALAQRQTEMFQEMMANFMSTAAPTAKTDGMTDRGMDVLRTMIMNGLELQKLAEKSKDAAMMPIFKRLKESLAEQKAAKR